MSNPVASTTGVEFFQHILGMWLTMTLPASFDGFVLVRVAFDALEGGMFCILTAQHFIRFAVTEGAYRVFGVVWICNF